MQPRLHYVAVIDTDSWLPFSSAEDERIYQRLFDGYAAQ
jgi:hypothetical protein